MMQLITDYGISLVIVVIFLYTVLKLINIFIRCVELRLDSRNHDTKLGIRESVGTKIQNSITEFLEIHKGNRVQVIEFSNSVMSIAYLPFRYMTCTYESYLPDLRGTAQKIDRVSTSLFTQFLDHFQNEDYSIFDITNHNKMVGGAMYDLMKDMEESRCICSMMKTSRGKSIGYVVMYKDSGFNEDDIEGIQSLRDSVASLLCLAEPFK